MKYIVQIFCLFFAFILFNVVVVSIATLSLPNKISFGFFNNYSLFIELLNVNVNTALQLLLIHNPVMVIEKFDDLGNAQVWGVYVMPISAITLMCLSMLIVYFIKLGRSQNYMSGLIFASLLLMISVFYIRMQACCTVNPSWVLDVVLLARVFDPLQTTYFWQDIYFLISPWFTALQTLLALSSVVVFYYLKHVLNNKKST